jgi:hypothetical protein
MASPKAGSPSLIRQLGKWLIPSIPWSHLLTMLGLTICGALTAGVFGVVHDQFTYTISPEYFTRLKFHQFHYANLGLGDRVFAGTIGFLASWWVGAVIAWVLARWLVPRHPRQAAVRLVLGSFGTVIAVTLVADLLAYGYGLVQPDAMRLAFQPIANELGVTDPIAFGRVALIHNASYAGGLVGLLIAVARLWHQRRKVADPSDAPR